MRSFASALLPLMLLILQHAGGAHSSPPSSNPLLARNRLTLKRSTPPLLFSIPGSGNTWCRILIDKAVGHNSGSVFCDKKLAEGLPGYESSPALFMYAL